MSVLPALPDELGGDEYIARFVYRERDLFRGDKAGQPKWTAFRPDLWEGKLELSVCRNTGLLEERIWAIGRTCRTGMKAIARADVAMATVHEQELHARYALGTFPEHSVVLGWRTGDSKDAHMMQMTELASAASGLFAPPEPACASDDARPD